MRTNVTKNTTPTRPAHRKNSLQTKIQKISNFLKDSFVNNDKISQMFTDADLVKAF